VLPRETDESRQPIGLRSGDAPAERRQPVITPPFIVDIGGRTARRFDDPTVFQHAVQRAIEGPWFELQGAVGEARNLLQDAVAVTFFPGKGEQDVEFDWT